MVHGQVDIGAADVRHALASQQQLWHPAPDHRDVVAKLPEEAGKLDEH